MSTVDRLAWRTSSYSGNGEGCVDVAPTPSTVFVRHAKHHGQGTIAFTAEQWSDFVQEVLAGRPSRSGAVGVTCDTPDTVVSSGDVRLRFNEIEWSAFVAGATDGEFDFQ
ncbi:DUF397 domain-containing protein [Nocardia sp. NBC_01327]|uniref:DUF397 domain-containing protein n=1 Tax=Nocardia sp. NBC_01327 TaxID=2903593 RepID=UPI002E1524B4|nr:DUF397 domain-containing protein [Nocardia sp. NBC_01327]